MNRQVFLGSYTRRVSKGIYRLADEPQLVAELDNPTYLTQKDGILYSIFGGDEGCGIVVYNIVNDHLEEIQKVYSDEKKGSCHISVDQHHEIIVTSNYHEHCFHVYKKVDGVWQEPTQVEIIEEGSHIHYAYYSNHTHILYVTDLGTDKVYMYYLDDLSAPFNVLIFPEGSGIRHIEFIHDDKIMYVNAEHSGQIFIFDDHKQIGQVKTNPDHDYNEAVAAIRASHDERFLVVSARTSNTIIVYSIGDGYLSEIQRFSSHGEHPRDFNFIDETTLLVANMNSDNLAFFTQNPDTGIFSYTHEIPLAEINCVSVVDF